MDNHKTKYDYKLMLGTAIILAIVIFTYYYWIIAKNYIRFILDAQLTYFILWIITVLIFLLHYIKHIDKDVRREIILTKKFDAFIDNALGGITYGTSITTALTLLKGLFIQINFSDIIYFPQFNNLDLFTVFGVVGFILYTSIMKVFTTAKETYKVQHTQQVFTENNIAVKPDSSIINSKL